MKIGYIIKSFKLVFISLFILQLVIAPGLSYLMFNAQNDNLKGLDFFMRVEPDVYFSITLPSVVLFILGLTLKLKMKNGSLSEMNVTCASTRSVLYLFIVVSVMNFANWFNIIFTKNLLYALMLSFTSILIIYIQYSKLKFKKILLAISYFYIIIQSAKTGMFGQFFFIIIVHFIFTVNLIKLEKKKIFVVFAAAFYLFLVVQNTKHIFRSAMDFGSVNLSLLASTIGENLTLNSLGSDDMIFNAFSLNIRMNQGFFLSHVYEHVPSNEEYTNGSHLFVGALGSLVPRFLWADKPMSGGFYELKKYAGLELSEGTSANISIIGDAYIVHGVYWSPIISFLFGLFLNYFYHYFLIQVHDKPLLIFWLPMFFIPAFQGVEENFVSLLNTHIKLGMIIFLSYLIFPRYLFRS